MPLPEPLLTHFSDLYKQLYEGLIIFTIWYDSIITCYSLISSNISNHWEPVDVLLQYPVQ